MTHRAARLAWSSWVLTSVLTLAGLVFFFLSLGTEIPGATKLATRAIDGLFVFPLAAFATVGALVAWRRPENPIGWIFCGGALVLALAALAQGYAIYALFADPGSLPGADVAAWVSVWGFIPAIFLIGALLLLLFPDGHSLSRRWRPVVWLAVAGCVILALGMALSPGPFEDDPFKSVENPFGIEGAESALNVLIGLAFIPFLLGFIAAAVSLSLRFRRSKGVVREQLKWVASAAVVTAVGLLSQSFAWAGGETVQMATGAFLFVGMTGIAVATGVAILRHRLYEIDLIIRRTLVYGVLTGSLAGLYLAIVIGLQQAFSGFAGGSDLAVAGSTLAVAALFRPARGQIQALVDRRFYRRRYDAQRTMEAFSARLRDEIDLDALAAELRRVVQETMQPAHVSLWLREPEGSR